MLLLFLMKLKSNFIKLYLFPAPEALSALLNDVAILSIFLIRVFLN